MASNVNLRMSWQQRDSVHLFTYSYALWDRIAGWNEFACARVFYKQPHPTQCWTHLDLAMINGETVERVFEYKYLGALIY